MMNRAHGLELTVPKRVPERPASSPRVEYTNASPKTYTAVRIAVRPRDRRADPTPPRIPAVMGIMGYTQGVRLVARPAPNRTTRATNGWSLSVDSSPGPSATSGSPTTQYLSTGSTAP
jgi:hypothetical protein